jgi:DNA polymerase-4
VIGHLDLDAFFAAVELHRRPELRGRPLVVGGDPERRGVVATASYAARKYGIRSAMSCAEAQRRCPDVVFVRPDMARYREWSERVWDLVARHSSCVEQVGIDEGYLMLDERGADHARAIQQALRDEVRLSASVGVATCKVVAKIASDRDKPGGVTVVARGDEAAFLAPLPLRALPGIGPRTNERLTNAGLQTIGDLAILDDEGLRAALPGAVGLELRDRARGVDPRPVASQPAERVSISMETTFDEDVRDPTVLRGALREWARDLAHRLTNDGNAARTIAIKLRYRDFQTITRARSLAAPTCDADMVEAVGGQLLDRALAERSAPIRLIGLGVSGLSPYPQLSFFAGVTLYERREDVYTPPIR